MADMVRVPELRAELNLRAKGIGSRIGLTGMALRPLRADRAGDLWEIRQMGTAGPIG